MTDWDRPARAPAPSRGAQGKQRPAALRPAGPRIDGRAQATGDAQAADTLPTAGRSAAQRPAAPHSSEEQNSPKRMEPLETESSTPSAPGPPRCSRPPHAKGAPPRREFARPAAQPQRLRMHAAWGRSSARAAGAARRSAPPPLAHRLCSRREERPPRWARRGQARLLWVRSQPPSPPGPPSDRPLPPRNLTSLPAPTAPSVQPSGHPPCLQRPTPAPHSAVERADLGPPLDAHRPAHRWGGLRSTPPPRPLPRQPRRVEPTET
jgi:hypothetical protein